MSRRLLIPVTNSAGDKYLIAAQNVVRVEECVGHKVELTVREPVEGERGLVIGEELNLYYVALTLVQFEGAYGS